MLNGVLNSEKLKHQLVYSLGTNFTIYLKLILLETLIFLQSRKHIDILLLLKINIFPGTSILGT